jgi:pre-mRNA-processing factor 19
MSDFIDIKTSPIAKPRPVASLSVTGILSALQSEWDGLMLETFQLRQALDATRSELSQALYQHEAACRVIAKLVKERDTARASLTNAQSTLAQRVGSASSASTFSNGDRDIEMSSESGGQLLEKESGLNSSSSVTSFATSIPETILTVAKDLQKNLAKERKARNKSLPVDFPSLSTLVSPSGGLLKLHASFSIHSHSVPEITCLESHPVHKNLVITGGNDKSAVLFNLQTGKMVSILNRGQHHLKAITSAAFHPTRDICVTSSLDGLVKVWAPTSSHSLSSISPSSSSSSSIPLTGMSSVYDVASSFRSSLSGSEVTGMSIHPMGDFAVSSNRDTSWSFSDLSIGQVVANFSDPASKSSSETYDKIRLHPDGLLVAIGTNTKLIKIFDLRNGDLAATFSGHIGAIRAITFGENGFSLASGSDDGGRFWDLRKQECTRHVALENSTACSAVSFEETSQYVALGGSTGRISLVDTKASDTSSSSSIVASITAHKGAVTGLSWIGTSAKTLVSVSLDGGLAHYGASFQDNFH